MEGVCAREGPVQLVDVDADGNVVAALESGTAGDAPFSNPARNADCCIAYTGTEESDPALLAACETVGFGMIDMVFEDGQCKQITNEM